MWQRLHIHKQTYNALNLTARLLFNCFPLTVTLYMSHFIKHCVEYQTLHEITMKTKSTDTPETEMLRQN